MSKETTKKTINRALRQKRVRTKNKMVGTAIPRLSVFKSLNHVYAQIIDDNVSKTLAAASDKEVKGKKKKEEVGLEVGKLLAQKAKKAGVEKVVFDRGRYKYHGVIKNLAEGARKEGLKF